MKLTWPLSLALLAVTCLPKTNQPPQVPGPVALQVNIQPILVTEQDGDHGWEPDDWDTQVRYAQMIWQEAGVSLNILETITIENEPFRVLDTAAERFITQEISLEHAQKKHVLVVWLVQAVILPDLGLVGGVANYPSNGNGGASHGVWLSQGWNTGALAHELGHSFGLYHTWNDPASDTPCKDEQDCESDPCNVMGYCSPCWYTGKHLSHDQIEFVQYWLQREPRCWVTGASN